MKEHLVPLLAGIAGTLAMTVFMLLPARLGIARVDVVRAAGAFVTKNRETAFVPGMVIHLGAGVLFAYVYYWFFHLSHLPLNALTGLFGGLVHGAVVMLIVGVAVLEHHPMKRYQRRGPMTGFAQVLGHAVYGTVVGAVLGAML